MYDLISFLKLDFIENTSFFRKVGFAVEHTRCTVQLILITSQKSFRTAFVKNCPQQHPIDFAIRWACKRNREIEHAI